MAQSSAAGLQNRTIDRLFFLRLFARTLSAVAPPAATRLAARVFATPHPRPPVSQREKDWAAGTRRFDVPTAPGRIAAWSWGDGPETVLLVHGWAGRGLQLGAFAEPLVARGYRVVTYDSPAHGASAGRRSSLIELAAAVDAVGRAARPLAGVIAHSFGAAAVLRAISRHGLDAPRLALIAPATDMQAITSRFAEITGFSPRVVEGMWRLFERRLGFAREELSLAGLVRGVDAPILVVHDSEDRHVDWQEGRALANASVNASFVATRGLGHYQALRSPEVVESVCRFISHSDTAVEPTVENMLADSA